MATTKKLLVRTPQTTNGKDLQYDENKQPVYSNSIVELAAKKSFENLNTKLPSHLRYELKEVDVDKFGNIVTGKKADAGTEEGTKKGGKKADAGTE